jgi:hypothetical protein
MLWVTSLPAGVSDRILAGAKELLNPNDPCMTNCSIGDLKEKRKIWRRVSMMTYKQDLT